MELIRNVAAILGCILSLITLLTLLSKGGVSLIKNIFKKNTSELTDHNEEQDNRIKAIESNVALILSKLKPVEEVSKQQCRNTLKNIYYRYCKEKKIPLYERKTADKTYFIYTKIFHENSYAALLYNEICKWEIDTISYQDLEEDDN